MQKSDKKRNKLLLAFIPILLALLLAGWLYRYITPYGVGLTNDSSAYLGGARSILNGDGYVRFSGDRLPRPITQFPPLYALKIAAIAKITGMNVFDAAWSLNLFCYGLNLLLFSFLTWRMTHKLILTGFSIPLYLCCGPILQAHGYGLSESFFLIFFLWLLIILHALSEKPHGALAWFGVGLLLGLMMLTRYAAIASVLTAGVFCIALLAAWRQKISRIISMTAGFLLIVAPWLLRNRMTGSAVNRSFAVHFPTLDRIRDGIFNLTGFFLPEFGQHVQKMMTAWMILWAVLLITGMAWLIVKTIQYGIKQTDKPCPLFLITLQMITALFVLIATAIFMDGSTVFDHRMLLPFFICAILLVLLLCNALIERKKWGAIASVALLLLFTVSMAEDEIDVIQAFHADGQGFTARVFRESETAHEAVLLPMNKTLYSNRQTFLWLVNNQPSYILPPLGDAATQTENEQFTKERDGLRSQILAGKACAIVFNYEELQEDERDRAWLAQLFNGMPIYRDFEDGVIFCKIE